MALFALVVVGCRDTTSITEVAPPPVVVAQGPAENRVGLYQGPTMRQDLMRRGFTAAAKHDVGWVRTTFRWWKIEPQPGVFDWAETDSIIAALNAAGIKPLVVLATTPVWVSSAPASIAADTIGQCAIRKFENYPPNDYDAWQAYVRTIVTRYKSSVNAWEIWNEPDIDGAPGLGKPCTQKSWCGSRHDYARLLATGAQAVHDADPKARVLLAGLAMTNPADSGFLRAVLRDKEYPAARSFDIAAFHFYLDPPLARDRAERVRALLDSNGAVGREMWVTETGLQSASDAAQVRYMSRVVPAFLSAGVSHVFWFRLFQPSSGAICAQAPGPWGLLRNDGSTRPGLTQLGRFARDGGVTFAADSR